MNRRLGCGVVYLFLLCMHGLEAWKHEEDPKLTGNDELSDSIKTLIRSLEPNPIVQKPRRISPDELITAASLRAAASRKLYFGEELQGAVPPPVIVSSQPINVNSARNKTGGGKRARSLVTAIDSDGVKTIEGVRVPDDEHDKFHTWRNARVIKNFLVENNRPANPHKKRQIILQDGQHYAVTATPVPAYGPTVAAKIIDISGMAQKSAYVQQQQQQQPQAAVYQQYTTAQDFASLYAAAAAQPVTYATQQQQQVYQTAASSPSATIISYPTGQLDDYAIQQAQQQQLQQQQQASSQQGQMYILQPDGKTYLPYNPTSSSSSPSVPIASAAASVVTISDPLHQSQSSQPRVSSSSAQSTFQSRTGESAADSTVETHPHLRQHAMKLQQEQAYQDLILSKHKNAEQQQQQQQQQRPAQQTSSHPSSPAPTIDQSSQFVRKSNEDPIQLAHIAATAIPAGQSIGQSIQEQIAAHSAEILTAQPSTPIVVTHSVVPQPQIHHYAQQPVHQQQQHQQIQQQHQQIQQQHHQQLQQQHQHQQQFQVIQQTSLPNGQSVAAMPVNPNQFVIQPQTYATGGGQMFSVPVPVPRDQIERQGQHRSDNDEAAHQAEKKKNSLTNKLFQSLNLKVDRRTAERVETSAVVPVLSSAGLLLGIGAIAASWYLSKTNREVGILKRNGKPANAAAAPTAPVPNSANNGGKDKAVVEHLRRRRQAEEIDQASFFQSIIQHGIEKTQQTYEPEEPVRAPVYKPSSSSKITLQLKSAAAPSPAAAALPPPPAPIPVLPSPSQKSDTLAEKSGKGSRLSKLKTFANVAIPAIVLGGSVIVIAALILGWYVSGTNREIAFLEPSAYSRRKRSLASSSALLADDGWLHSLITSIHPFRSATPDETRDALLLNPRNPNVPSYPFLDSSKSTPISDSDLTNLSIALSLAAFSFGALTVLGLAWYFTDNSRQVAWSDKGPISFGHFPTAYYGPRVRRSLTAAAPPHHRSNRRLEQSLHNNFLSSSYNAILASLEHNPSNRFQTASSRYHAGLQGAGKSQ